MKLSNYRQNKKFAKAMLELASEKQNVRYKRQLARKGNLIAQMNKKYGDKF